MVRETSNTISLEPLFVNAATFSADESSGVALTCCSTCRFNANQWRIMEKTDLSVADSPGD